MRLKFIRIFLLIAALLLLVACGGDAEPLPDINATVEARVAEASLVTQTLTPIAEQTLSGLVTRVIDGDTIEYLFDGSSSDIVRLLGVDTPETSVANQPGEYGNVTDIACLDKWGQAATQFARERLWGQKVVLVLDPAAGERGTFGRLLVYVHVSGVDFNALLVRRGYARVYTEGTASREQQYLRLQEDAWEEKRGLWECERPTPLSTEVSVGRDCDSSYPNVCIPPYPPDLDCDEIQYKRFEVLPPDRHGFDQDKDGIGCESG